MRTICVLTVGVLATCGLTAPAYGQRIEIQPLPGRLGVETPLLSADGLQKLKLTAEQKEKYDKIETTYKDAARSAQQKFRDDIKGLRDREKYKEASDKLQSDTTKARTDALGKVEPILTAEQKTVFATIKDQKPQLPGGIVRPIPVGGGGVGQILPPGIQQRLQLTDEQKQKLEAIQKEAEAKLMKVLTEDQKKQLENMKKGIIIRPQPIQPRPNPRIQGTEPGPAAPARKD